MEHTLSPDADLSFSVSHYLRQLGLCDETLIAQLAFDCLESARHRAAPGSEHELLRRALEEAQRRFNQALVKTLHIARPHDDDRPLAAARAAVLLRSPPFPTEALFRDGSSPPEWADELALSVPVSTPPESPQDMHETHLRFWLFTS
ncbi:MAG: hypothetical protein ACR2HF_11295 [Methylococcaceae bacterium]